LASAGLLPRLLDRNGLGAEVGDNGLGAEVGDDPEFASECFDVRGEGADLGVGEVA
jgi:hypothetical protein